MKVKKFIYAHTTLGTKQQGSSVSLRCRYTQHNTLHMYC